MKKIINVIILFFFIKSMFCIGQVSLLPADSQPATSNVRGAEYPRVTSDLRAIFQIKAPYAKKVQIKLGKIYDMVKDEKGIWSVTTDPLVPGFPLLLPVN